MAWAGWVLHCLLVKVKRNENYLCCWGLNDQPLHQPDGLRHFRTDKRVLTTCLRKSWSYSPGVTSVNMSCMYCLDAAIVKVTKYSSPLCPSLNVWFSPTSTQTVVPISFIYTVTNAEKTACVKDFEIIDLNRGINIKQNTTVNLGTWHGNLALTKHWYWRSNNDTTVAQNYKLE